MIDQKPEAKLTFKLKTTAGASISGTIGVTLEQWKEALKILIPRKNESQKDQNK